MKRVDKLISYQFLGRTGQRAYITTCIALLLMVTALWPPNTAHAATTSATYFTVPLAGATEIPGPGDPNGMGVAHLVLDPLAATVCYTLETAHIDAPTAGHIHQGAEGDSGGVAVALFGDSSGSSSGCASTDMTTIEAIIAAPADYYVNVHNAAFPAGAIRGQLQQAATIFTITLKNISGHSDLHTPFAPGVYAVHGADIKPFFDNGMADRGMGLEGLAEDGAAAELDAAVAELAGVSSSGVFAVPMGADGPGPLFPNSAYQFQIAANPGEHLSLASMLVQTNDIFVAPAETGIALFDSDGMPIHGNVSDQFPLWDAGTEINEAPGMGPNQAPRQAGANTGPTEGVVSPFTNSTRSLPLAGGIVDVMVSEADGTFTFTVINASATKGALITPIAPVFYATHNQQWSLFTTGQDASSGLESLAEDGSPAALVGEHTDAMGIGMVGAQPITVERPDDGPGPASPGESYSFDVTPMADYPYLSIAAMVVQSNDAFLAFDSMGIALLDMIGAPRPIEDVQADIDRMLAVWDAGTEANEVPGVGMNQAPRQAGANIGADDPISGVRFYSDATNDLAGGQAGGFVNLNIEHGPEPLSFMVTVNNTSDTTVYPGLLTPVGWAVHNDTVSLFQMGEAAPPGLEALAEDGNPMPLAISLAGNAAILTGGVAGTGPIVSGGMYSFTATVDPDHPYLSLATMVVPSNDTFLAFGPEGIRLLDEAGERRSEADLMADIAANFIAWDAGTEQNQAGASGPDQAPYQAGPNTGANEGSGTVMLISDADPVWDYPQTPEVAQIIIEPQMAGSMIPAEAPLPADPAGEVMTFTVRLENISGDTGYPGPFAPGVWAIHDANHPLFSVDQPDRGQGLEALAEDGNPAGLNEILSGHSAVASTGVFNTPEGADGPAPIFPGDAYEFQVTTTSTATRLSFATMLVQSNDIFAGPGAAGIPLFNDDGTPISGDISEMSLLWDAGTERNQAPLMGPHQAPRQPGADTGSMQGVVSSFEDSTRSLPLAGSIVDVMVAETDGTFSFTVVNNSAMKGALVTPIAPVFYATHDDQWSLFTMGESASAGLESLAEDGSPAALVGEHTGATGIGMVGAQPITVERPDADPGPASPGESYSFDVTPTAEHPYLSIAMMVVQSNDAFLAFGSKGLALMDSDGNPRSVEMVTADIHRALAVWDAGTEANEVPGVGPNQAPRQATANMGDADPDATVRLYADATNDLAGSSAGGFANLTIVHGMDDTSFMIMLNNTSGSTAYPGLLTPVVYATHNGQYKLFETGHPASPGLEALSEDGNPSTLAAELGSALGVGHHGVQAIAMGESDPGPISDGGTYTFMVMPDMAHPYLSLASMIVPSNDTFLAFGPMGVRLLNDDGTRRSEEDIAADIANDLIAWDAGTEQNQAGASGPDQAPRQAGPNTGADEGAGNVTLLNDPIWSYLDSASLLRVSVTPQMEMPEQIMGTVITVTLSGTTEVPGPGDEDGTGVAVLTLSAEDARVCYTITTENIDAPTAGHIHAGAIDDSGGVVITLFGDGADAASGCVDAEAESINAVLADQAGHYVNIHNGAFPSGAVRGQLEVADAGTDEGTEGTDDGTDEEPDKTDETDEPGDPTALSTTSEPVQISIYLPLVIGQ